MMFVQHFETVYDDEGNAVDELPADAVRLVPERDGKVVELTITRAVLAQQTRKRDEARAEVERMRPVVEAAGAYADSTAEPTDTPHVDALLDAVAAFRAALSAPVEAGATTLSDSKSSPRRPHDAAASQLQSAPELAAEAGAPAEPGYQQIADAIEAACDAAALTLDARRDGVPVEEPYLRLARVLDKAGLIDWAAFAGAPAEPTSDTEP